MSGEYYCKADNARTGHGQTDRHSDRNNIYSNTYIKMPG